MSLSRLTNKMASSHSPLNQEGRQESGAMDGLFPVRHLS
jgi:hypothetical protein